MPLDITVAESIEPESPRESLAHYAQRMAAKLGPRQDTFVGGLSLGAMIALEAATIMRADGVFVIGGCTSHRQISPLVNRFIVDKCS